jgi:F420-non-reducing hydrogenase small subunit
VYWTTGCGGCEAAFLDLGEQLLDLDTRFDVVCFPLLVDAKRRQLEELSDGSIDFCLITGAIRTTDDLEMARLLRRRSATVVAFGACAQLGSVLGLANVVSATALLRTVHGDSDVRGFDQPQSATGPRDTSDLPVLPRLTPALLPLHAAISVEYSVPGCPPEVHRVREVLELLDGAATTGAPLPPPGTVIGALDAAVCEECQLERPQGPVAAFVRQHQVVPDSVHCLLDQGLVCSGPATRGGCGAPCPAAGIGCRGCYGSLSDVDDAGSRMAAALAALAPADVASFEEAHLEHDADQLAASIVDPVGTLYRYCLADSLLGRLTDPRGGS